MAMLSYRLINAPSFQRNYDNLSLRIFIGPPLDVFQSSNKTIYIYRRQNQRQRVAMARDCLTVDFNNAAMKTTTIQAQKQLGKFVRSKT